MDNTGLRGLAARHYVDAHISVGKKMTLDDYQRDALRTVNGEPQLAMVALGLTGESGEFADIVKKHLFHGHDLDKDKAIKELGDVLWYVAVAAKTLGVSLEDVAQINVDKLRKRYPDGFAQNRSINRDEEK